MGILEKIQNGEFTGLSRALGGGKHSEIGQDGVMSTSTGGLGGGPQRVGGGKKWWDDEEGTGSINISLRILQTFLPFINLCIYIAIAAFQKHWKVGPSFLTGLSIFLNIQFLIHGAVFLSIPLLYDNFKFLRSLARGLKQIRTAIIINLAQTLFGMLMALVTTISAYGGGCKNPDNDPNKDINGYTDDMGGFCRNKRAGAAFFWFIFLAWLTTSVIIFLSWYSIRKNPTVSGFTIPGAQFPQDDEEAFNRHPSDVENNADGEGISPRGYRPSGDYYAGEGGRELFAEDGGYGNHQGEEEDGTYGRTERRDPFEDPQGEGREQDYENSYDSIRKSMDLTRPTYS